ncbi:DUF2946 domain-containing protein [Undibacterium sp. Rencai35W]|uniref:DUF2946 domain-containing protein n=1 Tax=Undibacterium sp. Rencai35W TaxID=3413046 RepID=UPI003BEF675A
MRLSFRLRTFTIWLACCALLLNVLMPSMAMPVRSQSGALIEICSAVGNKWVDRVTGQVVKVTSVQAGKSTGAASGLTPDSGSQQASSHCALCLLHSDDQLFLPSVTAASVVPRFTQTFSALFYQSPQPLFSWVSANPRAPPVLS